MVGSLRTLTLFLSPRFLRSKVTNLLLLWKARRSATGREVLQSHFDASYYLASYPDVARAGADPFWHYLLEGFREGRNPSSCFNTRDYLRRYPDVARAGLNPLLHYANYGAGEGRMPLRSGDLPLGASNAAQVIDPWIHLQDQMDDKPGFLLALPFITLGGAETLLRTISRALVDRGWRLVVVTTLILPPTMKDNTDSFAEMTQHVYPLPLLLGDGEERWEAFLRHLLVHYNVHTIMIAGCEFVYRVLPAIRREFPGVRIVDQLFNDEVHLPNNRQYARHIDMTIVPSQAFAETLVKKYRESPERVSVIPHGVCTTGPQLRDRTAALAASGLPAAAQGKFLVGFFGRMSEEKGPDVFVEIARRLRHQDEIFFCMTGDGPLRSSMLNLIERYALQSKIYAPGFVHDVGTLMELADVIVVPSRVDGMPLVVLEAQALGRPVVASAVGSIPEMIADNESGFLCEPGNVAAFSQRILELFGSPQKRGEIGAAAQQAVRRLHDQTTMIDAYLDVFRRIQRGTGKEWRKIPGNRPTEDRVAQPTIQLRNCSVCGSSSFAEYRVRSDGVAVVRCTTCGMGVVSQHPAELNLLYGDRYYHSGEETACGYEDYADSAEHGLAWAACLIRLLAPSGRVLDIGCADGHLLKKLLPSHDCYGIEVNAAMAARAAQAGIEVIANDIFEPAVLARYTQYFDVVSAVAVFEHVEDIKRAAEIAMTLLKPNGILLFEVPLISSVNPSDIWFRSSLEHVFYPFEESLHYLFETVLRLPLIGSEVVASDYGSVFIGVVPRDPGRRRELTARYHELVSSPIGNLTSQAEKEFRFALDVLHAAQTTPDRVALLRDIDFTTLPPAVWLRLADLWRRDVEKLRAIARYLPEVESARDWHAERSQGLERALAELKSQIANLK